MTSTVQRSCYLSKEADGSVRVVSDTVDGDLEVALFTGPNAFTRAVSYAGGSPFYAAWAWGTEMHPLSCLRQRSDRPYPRSY